MGRKLLLKIGKRIEKQGSRKLGEWSSSEIMKCREEKKDEKKSQLQGQEGSKRKMEIDAEIERG